MNKATLEELYALCALARQADLELAFRWLGKAIGQAEKEKSARRSSGRRRMVKAKITSTGAEVWVPKDLIDD